MFLKPRECSIAAELLSGNDPVAAAAEILKADPGHREVHRLRCEIAERILDDIRDNVLPLSEPIIDLVEQLHPNLAATSRLKRRLDAEHVSAARIGRRTARARQLVEAGRYMSAVAILPETDDEESAELRDEWAFQLDQLTRYIHKAEELLEAGHREAAAEYIAEAAAIGRLDPRVLNLQCRLDVIDQSSEDNTAACSTQVCSTESMQFEPETQALDLIADDMLRPLELTIAGLRYVVCFGTRLSLGRLTEHNQHEAAFVHLSPMFREHELTLSLTDDGLRMMTGPKADGLLLDESSPGSDQVVRPQAGSVLKLKHGHSRFMIEHVDSECVLLQADPHRLSRLHDGTSIAGIILIRERVSFGSDGVVPIRNTRIRLTLQRQEGTIEVVGEQCAVWPVRDADGGRLPLTIKARELRPVTDNGADDMMADYESGISSSDGFTLRLARLAS